jgi:membrane protein
LIIISIVGFIYGEKAASGQLFSQLSDVVGSNAAKSIQGAVAHTHTSGGGVVALVLGTIGAILGAVGLSNQLQNSFNIIFDAVPDPKSGIKRTFYTKVKNFILIAAAGVVLLISVVLSTLVSALSGQLHEHFNVPPIAVEFLNTAVSLLIFIGIIYLIYKVLPDVFIPKKIILVTAAVVSLLFIVGKNCSGSYYWQKCYGQCLRYSSINNNSTFVVLLHRTNSALGSRGHKSVWR